MEPMIYSDPQFRDLGVIDDYEIDLTFGTNDSVQNDFELVTNQLIEPGSLIYIDGTEYGGIIDAVKTDSASEMRMYFGRTWHGILTNKVLSPPDGSDYYTVTGEVSELVADLISKLGLSGFFGVGHIPYADVSHTYNRYIDGYSALIGLLERASLRPSFVKRRGMCQITAEPIRELSNEANSDLLDLVVRANRRVVNHLVCVGRGELQDRLVVNLYADALGNVSNRQTFFGIDEIAEVYDFTAADRAALVEYGTQRLKDYQEPGEVAIADEEGIITANIGDYLRAVDYANNVQATARVTRVILNATANTRIVKYEVGAAGIVPIN